MATLAVGSFKEAQALARSCATYFFVDVRVMPSRKGFAVSFPNPLRIPQVEPNGSAAHALDRCPTRDLLPLMAYVDRSQVSSNDLAWHDRTSGLMWDVARLLYGGRDSEYPAYREEWLNALGYAGLSRWRVPTIDELRTLSIEKLGAVGVASPDTQNIKFWSCERSRYAGPEKAQFAFEAVCFDIVSQTEGHQEFRESGEQRRSSFGGHYTEYAQTMLVCSDLIE